ncbi:hypothetical protein R6Q59_025326 [Mikania micrantha]
MWPNHMNGHTTLLIFKISIKRQELQQKFHSTKQNTNKTQRAAERQRKPRSFTRHTFTFLSIISSTSPYSKYSNILTDQTGEDDERPKEEDIINGDGYTSSSSSSSSSAMHLHPLLLRLGLRSGYCDLRFEATLDTGYYDSGLVPRLDIWGSVIHYQGNKLDIMAELERLLPSLPFFSSACLRLLSNRFWGKRVSRKKLSIEDPPRTVIIFCFRLPSSFASDDPVVKLFEDIVMFLNSPLLNHILSTGCDDRRRFVSDFAQRGCLEARIFISNLSRMTKL